MLMMNRNFRPPKGLTFFLTKPCTMPPSIFQPVSKCIFRQTNCKKSFSRRHLPWHRWFSKPAGISFLGCLNAKKSFTRTHITLSRGSQNPSGIPFSSGSQNSSGIAFWDHQNPKGNPIETRYPWSYYFSRKRRASSKHSFPTYVNVPHFLLFF